MTWDASSAKALEALAGAYALPGGCWAVLNINHSPPKNTLEAASYPEGYGYTWAVLAPGEPPNLRGHRMSGIDNSNDSHVRDQIKANPQLGSHRAHRHFADWQDVKTVRGQVWPVAGPGIQLANAPAAPQDFWIHCMNCLNETLDELGLDIPDEKQLFASHMTEKAFLEMQKKLRPGQQSGLVM